VAFKEGQRVPRTVLLSGKNFVVPGSFDLGRPPADASGIAA